MQIKFKATKREEQGSSASRRLRRAGQLPGVIYGAEKAAQPIALDHNELYHLLRREAFHASLLTVELDGKKETVILRDAQWHPYKPQVLHIDFQRVDQSEKVRIKVPLHFLNSEISPAVKPGGCIIAHVMNELDVQCLPADLPEFIEVDLSTLESGQSLHISQLVLPKGVEAAPHGEGDPVVVSALLPKGAAADSDAAAAGEEASA